MVYRLDFSSMTGTEPIETKHQRLFDRWAQLGEKGPWRLAEIPRVPLVFCGGTLTHRVLNFADRHIKGTIYYHLRVPECAQDSDFIDVEFNPEGADYSFLIREVIPMIIETFPCYQMTLGDDRFREPSIGADGIIHVGGPRACGGFLEPVFYMSEERIKETFGLSTPSFVEKITPVVEKVIIIGKGALVIGSSSILPFDEAVKLTRVMESSLRKEPFFEKTQRLLGIRPVKRD